MVNLEIVGDMISKLNSSNSSVRNITFKNINFIFNSLGVFNIFKDFFPYICHLATLTEYEWKIILSVTEKMNFGDFSDAEIVQFTLAIFSVSFNESDVFIKFIPLIIKKFCEKNNNKRIEKFIFPLIVKLVSQDWISCQIIGLRSFCVICSRLNKEIIDSFFLDNCSNMYSLDNVKVNATFIDTLRKSLNFLSNDSLSNSLTLVKAVSNSFELTIIEANSIIRFLFELSKSSKCLDDCIEICSALTKSNNWIIREKIIQLLPFVSGKKFGNVSQTILNTFILDPCKEVRSAAAKSISFYEYKSSVDISNIKKIIQILLNDKEEKVIISSLNSLNNLSNVFGIDFVLKSIISSFDNENQLVKIEALRILESDSIPLESTFEAICNGLVYFEWREKVKIAQIIEHIIKADNSSTLPKRLIAIIGLLLNDENASVRENCAKRIGNYILLIGDKIDKKILISIIERAANNNDYQIRQTAVQAISYANLCEEEKHILNKLVDDKVSNVRLFIARYAPIDIAKKLINDPDEDVKEAFKTRLL